MLARAAAVFLSLSAASAATVHAKQERWQSIPMPPPMPAADKTGETPAAYDAKIAWATYGTKAAQADDRPWVILLHGGLGNYTHFAFLVPALVDKYRVLGIDTRGQGHSTLGTNIGSGKGQTHLTYHLLATDVIAVMDALAIKKASIVGWSDGGEMALDLAIHEPDRVAKIFVLGANYDDKGSKPRSGAHYPTFEAYAVRCKQDYVRMSKTPRGWDTIMDAMLPVWRNPAGFTKEQLKAIQAPTMMADGDHDEVIVLDQVKEMAQLIPHGQLAVFANTSHFAMWQAPDEVNRTIVDFLAQ